ncbi:MAG: hypothetical protein JNM20_07185 [Rhizobiales bacterium]|jgi:hypothetical protein|nr:hypothetical protein [Hyphomicrobiales bacterium]
MIQAKLDFKSFGAGLSATLAALVIVCAAAAALFPGWQVAHNWLSLFSPSVPGSLRNFIEGLAYSVIFGWMAAAIFVSAYNLTIRSKL